LKVLKTDDSSSVLIEIFKDKEELGLGGVDLVLEHELGEIRWLEETFFKFVKSFENGSELEVGIR
jgi:hypothetical protein